MTCQCSFILTWEGINFEKWAHFETKSGAGFGVQFWHQKRSPNSDLALSLKRGVQFRALFWDPVLAHLLRPIAHVLRRKSLHLKPELRRQFWRSIFLSTFLASTPWPSSVASRPLGILRKKKRVWTGNQDHIPGSSLVMQQINSASQFGKLEYS